MRDLWENTDRSVGFQDCGERALEHWLYIHRILFEDVPHLHSCVAVHFETLSLGNTTGLLML